MSIICLLFFSSCLCGYGRSSVRKYSYVCLDFVLLLRSTFYVPYLHKLSILRVPTTGGRYQGGICSLHAGSNYSAAQFFCCIEICWNYQRGRFFSPLCLTTGGVVVLLSLCAVVALLILHLNRHLTAETAIAVVRDYHGPSAICTVRVSQTLCHCKYSVSCIVSFCALPSCSISGKLSSSLSSGSFVMWSCCRLYIVLTSYVCAFASYPSSNITLWKSSASEWSSSSLWRKQRRSRNLVLHWHLLLQLHRWLKQLGCHSLRIMHLQRQQPAPVLQGHRSPPLSLSQPCSK